MVITAYMKRKQMYRQLFTGGDNILLQKALCLNFNILYLVLTQGGLQPTRDSDLSTPQSAASPWAFTK